MLEAGNEPGTTVSFVFADGETLTFTVAGDWPASERIVNGGLPEATLLLAQVVAAGVVGNAAYDALNLGVRFLRQRVRWGAEEDQQRYVEYIAHLAVAAKLDGPSRVKVKSCKRQTDHWDTVVVAAGRTYRVRAPLDAPRPTAISVDVE